MAKPLVSQGSPATVYAGVTLETMCHCGHTAAHHIVWIRKGKRTSRCLIDVCDCRLFYEQLRFPLPQTYPNKHSTEKGP